MLPSTIRRVFIAEHRVDFRKHFDGLLGEAYRLGADPYDGDCVVFMGQDHTQVRVIFGDKIGLFLMCRRFEGGRLKKTFPFAAGPSCKSISLAELGLLLEGATFTVHSRAKAWRK